MKARRMSRQGGCCVAGELLLPLLALLLVCSQSVAAQPAASADADVRSGYRHRGVALFTPAQLEAFKKLAKGNVEPFLTLANLGGKASNIGAASTVGAAKVQFGSAKAPPPPPPSAQVRKEAVQVTYKGGRILSGPGPIVVHLIWYGAWDAADQAVIRDFIQSFSPVGVPLTPAQIPAGTVAKWWSVTSMYTDRQNRTVSRQVLLGKEFRYARRKYGVKLSDASIRRLVRHSLVTHGGALPVEDNHVYLVLNGPEISQVPEFCRSMCAFHDFLPPRASGFFGHKNTGKYLAFAWIGNPAKSCPSYCGFPFELPPYIPKDFATVVKPPNGKLALDAMIGLIAHEMGDMSTNPFVRGWYAGDPLLPGEVSDMCIGIYGPGAFPAYPGALQTTSSGAGYNVVGVNGRKFLVPWLWNRNIAACAQTTT